MTPRQKARIAATLMAGLLTTAAHAGENPVDPFATVFIPPAIVPPPVVPGTTPVQAGGTAAPAEDGTGAAAAAAEETEAAAAADAQSGRATRAFIDAQFFCARLSEPEYRVDCLSDQLAQYAAALPQSAEFDEARDVVTFAATRLNEVARRNASTTKRPGRLQGQSTGGAPLRSTRPIVPVATERLEPAFDLASSILREAETQLLRAAEQSERRRVAFTEIAEAVGGSTILLRSS